MKGNQNRYVSASMDLYPGRESSQAYYLREHIQFVPLSDIKKYEHQLAFGILGYGCDEGVRRNLGRLGAATGPDSIRKKLGMLANHIDGLHLTDFGSILCEEENLNLAHHEFQQATYSLFDKNYFPILLGGGHDITLPHFQALRHYLGSTQRIGIINFDTHFDLRQPIDSVSTSGTTFFEIASQVGKNDFYYLPIGIQKACNHKGLFELATELSVPYIDLNQCLFETKDYLKSQLLQFISRVDYLMITIDMDCFSSAYSPGVSASNPIGLSPSFVLEMLQFILKSNKIKSIDIAETNPSHDVDNRSASLAAHLIWHSIKWISNS